ncbi:MAG: GntR family transcriptional regulator [Clostridiales bacterium]|nr:GntR family transcriptional regulator [Clostridiales bacterium]
MRIVLSNDSRQAIWEQIADQIKDAIMKGDLSPGDPLPSIRALARDLRISVITTKRAYDELEAERFVESVQGKGSFVAAQDTAMMREKRLKTIEERLSEALIEARLLGFEYEELERMLRILWEE